MQKVDNNHIAEGIKLYRHRMSMQCFLSARSLLLAGDMVGSSLKPPGWINPHWCFLEHCGGMSECLKVSTLWRWYTGLLIMDLSFAPNLSSGVHSEVGLTMAAQSAFLKYFSHLASPDTLLTTEWLNIISHLIIISKEWQNIEAILCRAIFPSSLVCCVHSWLIFSLLDHL